MASNYDSMDDVANTPFIDHAPQDLKNLALMGAYFLIYNHNTQNTGCCIGFFDKQKWVVKQHITECYIVCCDDKIKYRFSMEAMGIFFDTPRFVLDVLKDVNINIQDC